MSNLRQIKASAGSGKTYTLTGAYLSALLQSAPAPGRAACQSDPDPAGHGYGEILAITFTNAAAAEMRARIISRLKQTALGVYGNKSPAAMRTARQWLSVILRDMSSLNIRTIDSLLHMIVRASVLQLGLSPSFEPVFESAEVIEPYIEKFLELAAEDPVLASLVRDAVLVFALKSEGFGAYDKFTRNLSKAFEGALLGRYNTASQPDLIQAAWQKMENASLEKAPMADAESDELLARLARSAQALLDACSPEIHAGLLANAQKQLSSLAAAEQVKAVPKFISEQDLRQAFKKSCKADFSALQEHFACLCESFERYQASQAQLAERQKASKARQAELAQHKELLQRALNLAPFIRLAQILAQKFRADLANLDQLPSALIPALATRVLESDSGVSDTICRMGSRLTHFLVDEFQDTSREQWQVLRPLVIDALSRGGSLTWVGDVKQSIYGWRNGDPSLFEEVLADPELARLEPEPGISSLPVNWRSRPNIVEFNNSIFSQLGDQACAEKLLEELFSKKFSEPARQAAARRIASAYSDCIQQISPDFAHCDEKGYVFGAMISPAEDQDFEDATLERLGCLLEELHTRRPWSDILILARSNNEILRIARQLIAGGIPVITDNSLVLEADQVVSQLVSTLTFLDNPDNNLAFYEIFQGPIMRMACPCLADQNPDDWVALASSGGRPLFRQFAEDFPDCYTRVLAPFLNGAVLMGPYDLVMEWCAHLKIQDSFPDSVPFVRRFMEVAQCAEEKGYTSLSTFLEFWQRHGKEQKAPAPTGMDAIRLMTIHKAKGLQAPVCIVPWTNFSIMPSGKHEIVNYGELRIPVAVTGEAAGEAYFRELAKQTLESLNMLYVAFTRAQEELYFFAGGAGNRVARLTDAFLMLLAGAGMSLPLETGAKPGGAMPASSLAQEPYPIKTPEIPAGWSPLGWLRQLKIYRNKPGKTHFSPEERGVFMHFCLERLQFSGYPDKDALRAFQFGLRHGGITVPESEHEGLIRSLRWFAALPNAAQWLQAGWAEHPLLNERGQLLRTDLLVPADNGALVIDYKTGNPTENHLEQVRSYMRCVAESGQFGPEVNGLLIYLTLCKFRLVGPVEATGLMDDPRLLKI